MGQDKGYEVTYHPSVLGEITKLDAFWQRQVLDAIESKLFVQPEFFGKPLRQDLRGLWKLRVGDYRVVFEIKKKVVYIISIRHRREGYAGIGKRI